MARDGQNGKWAESQLAEPLPENCLVSRVLLYEQWAKIQKHILKTDNVRQTLTQLLRRQGNTAHHLRKSRALREILTEMNEQTGVWASLQPQIDSKEIKTSLNFQT